MDRGCTRLEATGTYEGRKNGALLCVVSRMEAFRLKTIVSECDPHAFVTVCDVHEALGEGFTYDARRSALPNAQNHKQCVKRSLQNRLNDGIILLDT